MRAAARRNSVSAPRRLVPNGGFMMTVSAASRRCPPRDATSHSTKSTCDREQGAPTGAGGMTAGTAGWEVPQAGAVAAIAGSSGSAECCPAH